ncbi:MAG: ABC transporter substrate-binding protein, partial [Dehalococcoidia bacterium]
MKRKLFLITLLFTALVIAACGNATDKQLSPVTFMLDWVPNTNHTGIFVAQSKGYFDEVGLSVNIIQPGEVYPEAAVASGATDFGISFQEYVTLSRADQVPIVSIAAIIQHNTSGFASAADLKVQSPADFEGLRYGSFGTPFEAP